MNQARRQFPLNQVPGAGIDTLDQRRLRDYFVSVLGEAMLQERTRLSRS